MHGDIIESMREHVLLVEALDDFATSEIVRDYLEELDDLEATA